MLRYSGKRVIGPPAVYYDGSIEQLVSYNSKKGSRSAFEKTTLDKVTGDVAISEEAVREAEAKGLAHELPNHLVMEFIGHTADAAGGAAIIGVPETEPKPVERPKKLELHDIKTALASGLSLKEISAMVLEAGGEDSGGKLDKSGQDVGDDKSGQDVGDDKSGQNVGDTKSGQNVGDDKSGQNEGDNKSGQNVGGDKSGQNVGGDRSGQNEGDSKPEKKRPRTKAPHQTQHAVVMGLSKKFIAMHTDSKSIAEQAKTPKNHWNWAKDEVGDLVAMVAACNEMKKMVEAEFVHKALSSLEVEYKHDFGKLADV